jgi:hypothetical protein
MKEWTRGDVIALVGLVVATISCLAAILAIPSLRRLVGFAGKDIWIHTPKNKEKLSILYGEHLPIVRTVSGHVTGYSEKEVERLGLFVEVLIKTDSWYPQGSARVDGGGKWTLKETLFGGSLHVIKAVLKDRHGREHESAEIEVTVS